MQFVDTGRLSIKIATTTCFLATTETTEHDTCTDTFRLGNQLAYHAAWYNTDSECRSSPYKGAWHRLPAPPAPRPALADLLYA